MEGVGLGIRDCGGEYGDGRWIGNDNGPPPNLGSWQWPNSNGADAGESEGDHGEFAKSIRKDALGN